MDNTAYSFGQNLKQARLKAGLTQLQMAKKSGVDRATISLIENDREQPRTDTILKLARVLGLSPSSLWRSTNELNSYEAEETNKPLKYEPIDTPALHSGLRELLSDERTRLMLQITDEEEIMLRSIRTRSEARLGKDFFIDVLVSFRRHHSE